MKNPTRETISRLEELPNVGLAIAGELRRTGVAHPKELVGRDAREPHETLCGKLGGRQDPCVSAAFMSFISWEVGH